MRLIPFENTAYTKKFEIHARVEKTPAGLKIEFQIRGQISEIDFPKMGQYPEAADKLWESTCFEAFLAPADSPAYLEINSSPSGDWAVYHFESYRKKSDQKALPQIRSTTSNMQTLLTHSFEIPCELSDGKSDVNLTAVLKSHYGDLTYWAVKHSSKNLGGQPDFHDRDTFSKKAL